MSTVPNDARWMDVGPLPSNSVVPFHACIQYVYVLPMYIFSPIIRVLAIFQFLVVLLFTEMHIHKEVDKGT